MATLLVGENREQRIRMDEMGRDGMGWDEKGDVLT